MAMATARVKTYPIRRICLSPDDSCRRIERPLSAPSSDKRWLGLLSYMANPTCVNNIEIKKAKLLATSLTVALSTIQYLVPTFWPAALYSTQLANHPEFLRARYSSATPQIRVQRYDPRSLPQSAQRRRFARRRGDR